MSFDKRVRGGPDAETDHAVPRSEGSAALVLRDPTVMRALAHPRRIELLRVLRTSGPATATMLGEATGQSPASASYHLRQLAVHHLVEEVAGKGVGRERWWRARHPGTRVEVDAFLASDTRTAAVSVAAAALGDSTRLAVAFLNAAERGEVNPEWLDAALLDDTTVHATPEELLELGRRLAAVIRPFVRADASARPPGAQPCHVSIRALPPPPR